MFTAIPDITRNRAQLTPDAIAFREWSGGATVSYADLEWRAQCAAGLLRATGVGPGDRVAVLCRNRSAFFEILFACGKLGAIMVPLNWRMPPVELEPLLDEVRPVVLFYGDDDRIVANVIGDRCRGTIDLDDDGPAGYGARRNASQPHAGRNTWPADECWYLLYTSGTTGQPKAVIQTYGMAIANYINIRQAMSISGNDVTLNYLPLFHTAGINLVTLPTLFEGGEVLVLPGFDLDAIIEILRDHRIDSMFAVPAVYQQISLHSQFTQLDLGRIRSWGSGGAPLPESLVSVFFRQGARICAGMGMTETGPTVFIMDTASVASRAGSVGKPQLLASVRIVDANNDDVAPGEQGELWFAGPGITPGYWGRDDATRAAFSDDGWLKSGDIGRCDEDGYYYIVGRSKDMYISGGENVYPAEVENHFAAHPDVLEAAVVALPDDTWGEVGCAYLLAMPGHALPSADELRRYGRERMAAYKVPKQFVEVDEFPRTAAGKIQKHLLGAS